MTNPQRPPTTRTADFRVGEWLAEPALNRLTRGQTALRIRPQLMDVLACLARHQGRVVLKDELLAEVWPDRIITESGMVRCIAELRQLLGDDSREPRYIETISKRGYRLLTPVEWMADEHAARAAERPATSAAGQTSDEPPDPGAPVTPPPVDLSDATGAEPAISIVSGSRWWRRAAAAAAAVAVVATAVVFVVRRPGAAALTEKDVAVLAFENVTGDKVFDDTLPLALAIQLEQSPFLRILSTDRVREILGLMKRSPDLPITRTVGLEVCERAGGAALIVASVTPLGQHYVIGIEALACVTREVFGRQQIEVAGKQQVLGALGRAAAEIRRDLGESRASIAEYNVPVTEATTASLDALRALRQGDGARERGQSTEALHFYREAVRLDPDFALALVRLGAFALAQHYEPEGVAALERAFAIRDRVTFPERLEIDLVYHANLTGDQNKVAEALETMRRVYPARPSVRRRLAIHYLQVGRFDEALSEAREARTLDPASEPALSTLAEAYLVTNRLQEAKRTIEEAITRNLAGDVTHSWLLRVGFLLDDAALVAREREWAATHTEAQPFFLEAEAEEAVWRGRLRDSIACLDRYQAWCRQRGADYRWIVLELRKARYEALGGFSARASARAARQLATGKLGPDLQVDALKVAVSAGDVARVERLLADLDRTGWPKAEEPFAGFVLAYRAALDTDRGRPQQALERLAPMTPFELGLNWGLIPLHERARAHLKAGGWQQARDAYQKMLDHPGVFSGQKLLPLAQLGLARSLAAGGLVTESRAAYGQFLQLWKDADPDLPLLADARRELAALR